LDSLVVVAHPDDEVLGAGGTIYKLSQSGYCVNVCILSGEVHARNNRPTLEQLADDVKSSSEILGVKTVINGHFPNIEFNTVPHLELVKFIEDVLVETKPDVVFTHHPGDLNNDHLHTSLACQAAVRMFQRNPEIKPIKELLFMEIPSATDWSLNRALGAFNPNVFVEIGNSGVDKKLEALSQYRGVMRDYPHPRSSEALAGLAAYRGGQAGMKYAEAFESAFRRWEIGRTT
jgi:LmbE family N-acetylglucosaminyl deacetylase